MFDKVKQLNDLRKMRSQAMDLQKQLKEVTHMEEERGIRVVVSADQKIVSLSVDGEERKEMVEVVNKAFKEVQKKAAKKMMEMGGGLEGLLGGMKS